MTQLLWPFLIDGTTCAHFGFLGEKPLRNDQNNKLNDERDSRWSGSFNKSTVEKFASR